MAKTVSLPPVRVEPETLAQMQQISEDLGTSVYELTRVAVAEFIRRHQVPVGLRPDQAAAINPS